MNAPLRLAALTALSVLTFACADSTLDDPAPADQTDALAGADAASLRAIVRNDPLSPSVAAVCLRRVDALCAALGDLERDPAAASARAREVVKARFAAEPRGAVLADPAVRLYLRERVHALHAMLSVTDNEDDAPSDFATRVDAHVSKHHSLYDRAAFAAARGWLPPRLPAQRCDEAPTGLLLVFPGVIRLPSRAELEGQIRAVTAVFPCLRVERVDTGTFVEVGANAAKGREVVARVDATLGRQLPIHVLGYSQGVTNGLAMLASSSAIAVRTQTFVALSPATHGAESADALLSALGVYQERPDAGCGDLIAPLRDLCRQVASSSLTPVASFMQAMLERMGAHFDDIPGSTVGGWLETHIAGLRSLSTAGTARFWADAGPKLPRDTAYITFRSVITDERKMLPTSNWLSYQTIWRSSRTTPFNDMQVRLTNLPLGGPIADREIVLRVADGNHWMWELTPADVPSNLMSPEMFAGVPRNELVVAQYITLAEVGLLFGGG